MVNINQRGVTIAAAAVGAYGPDRWKKVDAGNMTQVVEDVNFVPGAKYTLSWKGGTPQVLTAPGTGHWTLPNIPITATEIQLELGEVATPFERRSYGQELSLCQRYCYVVGGEHVNQVFATAINVTTTQANAHFFHPVRMRGSPTFTVSAAGDLQISTGAFTYICTAVVAAGAQSSISSIAVATVASGLTLAQPTRIEAHSLNARMIWSIEL
jgi:hypothetical protein